ncbi:MAG TPA: homoserine kinase [Pseudomonadales bacterium]|nr:homoserine kinase [Pseudomonadales bacterium]
MRVHVRVPATSANLGPGFDVLGLALALHNDIDAEEADGVSVMIEGEGAGRLETGARNVVARAVRMAFEAAGRPFRGVALHCVNRIPPSRGLGSSAAAWMGGLVAGNALAGGGLSRDTLLELATRAEGHPDNVAAALLGGLTVSCHSGDRVVALSLPVPPTIRWVVLIPEIEGSTEEARAVLAASVSRADAVFNLQRMGLLLGALSAGRLDLLPAALDDRLHQPQRWRLFPWLPAAVAAARGAGALGCVLSGAGPSLLAPVAGPGDAVSAAMEAALHETGTAGRAVTLAVDVTGVTCEPVA